MLYQVNLYQINQRRNVNKIIINGNTFEVDGNNVSVQSSGSSSIVQVNGKTVISTNKSPVKVIFEGDLANLECHNAEIHGDVKGNVDAHNVNCRKVGGNIDAHNVFNR